MGVLKYRIRPIYCTAAYLFQNCFKKVWLKTFLITALSERKNNKRTVEIVGNTDRGVRSVMKIFSVRTI